MMELLPASRARRLDVIMEILETCQDMRQRVDVDIVSALLEELVELCGPEPEKTKPLTDEELRAYCGIDGALKALCDVAEALANTNQPRRVASQLRDLRRYVRREFWLPRLSLMTKEDRAKFTAETLTWGYTLVPPEVQIGLLDILDRASRGAYIGKELRAGSAVLFKMLNATWPMGNRRMEEGTNHAAGDD